MQRIFVLLSAFAIFALCSGQEDATPTPLVLTCAVMEQRCLGALAEGCSRDTTACWSEKTCTNAAFSCEMFTANWKTNRCEDRRRLCIENICAGMTVAQNTCADQYDMGMWMRESVCQCQKAGGFNTNANTGGVAKTNAAGASRPLSALVALVLAGAAGALAIL